MATLSSLVVTVSGLHGTGKSTYAKTLAKAFKMRHISAGELFRNLMKEKGIGIHEFSVLASRDRRIDHAIDDRIMDEARNGNVIIDGQLAAWMAREFAQVKFYLLALDQTRFERIAKRDKISLTEARRVTLDREQIEKDRYKKYYNINIDDLSIYDLVLNTELLSLNSNIELFIKVIEDYKKKNLGR